MKKICLIINLVFLTNGFSQTLCDCKEIKGNTGFTGFCTEYLNKKLSKSTKEEAVLKLYMFYTKGNSSIIYPFFSKINPSFIYCDSREVKPGDSLLIANGLYKFCDKKKRVTDEILFRNGLIVKHVNKDWGVLFKRRIGKQVFEIAEYDYTKKPMRSHYIKFKDNGQSTKYNFFIKFENGAWYVQQTDIIMSADPIDFKGVPHDLSGESFILFQKW